MFCQIIFWGNFGYVLLLTNVYLCPVYWYVLVWMLSFFLLGSVQQSNFSSCLFLIVMNLINCIFNKTMKSFSYKFSCLATSCLLVLFNGDYCFEVKKTNLRGHAPETGIICASLTVCCLQSICPIKIYLLPVNHWCFSM